MRTPITSHSNPDSRKDWLISFTISDPTEIKLIMIPDKLIAEHASIKRYLIECAQGEFSNPEEMTLQIIEDINNDLVPKWIKVICQSDGVKVEIEDQQPGLDDLNTPD